MRSSCSLGNYVAVAALALASGPGCGRSLTAHPDEFSDRTNTHVQLAVPRYAPPLEKDTSHTQRTNLAQEAALALVEFDTNTATWKMRDISPDEKRRVLEHLREAFLVPGDTDLALSYGWRSKDLEHGSSVHESTLAVGLKKQSGAGETVGEIELDLLFAPLNNPIVVVSSFEDSADRVAAHIEQRIRAVVLDHMDPISRWKTPGAGEIPASQRNVIASQLSYAAGLPNSAVSVTNTVVQPAGLPGAAVPPKVLATVINVGSQVSTYYYAGNNPGELFLCSSFAVDPRSLMTDFLQQSATMP